MTEWQHRTGRRSAVMLLGVAVVVGALAVLVTYGIAAEYGDASASPAESVRAALVANALVVLVVLGLCGLAARRRTGWRWVRPAAALVAVATLVGVPAGQVLGVEAKWVRYRTVPDCVGEFRSGPAVPVVRAAQETFEELEHPGRFPGGGSAGIDGCETQLVVRGEGDVLTAYRSQLVDGGWRLVTDSASLLRGVRDGEAVEVRPDHGGATIWVGPAELERRELDDGEVGPRT